MLRRLAAESATLKGRLPGPETQEVAVLTPLSAAPIAQRGRWDRRGLFEVEIGGAGVEIDDPVHRFGVAAVFRQAVAQAVGLEVLLTPPEAHTARQVQGARFGFVFEAIRQQPAPGQIDLHIAAGHEAIQQAIKALLIGLQSDLC
ncbi:MAG: hypothetical protein ACKO6G_08365, partial [Vulcanococcus sp.]